MHVDAHVDARRARADARRCTRRCTPCTRRCTPCTRRCTPCTRRCTPCTRRCTPCTRRCTPCTRRYTPCTRRCTRRRKPRHPGCRLRPDQRLSCTGKWGHTFLLLTQRRCVPNGLHLSVETRVICHPEPQPRPTEREAWRRRTF